MLWDAIVIIFERRVTAHVLTTVGADRSHASLRIVTQTRRRSAEAARPRTIQTLSPHPEKFIVSRVLNLDPAKLLVVAVVAIILLGPDRLPQVARQVGTAWRTFNEFRHRVETDVRSAVPDLPSTHDIARLTRSPSTLLNDLSDLGSGADTIAADGVVVAPSDSGGTPGVLDSHASDESDADSRNVGTPAPPDPLAVPEMRPIEVVVSDPHLN
jgi:Sec-independent protein translocase protein TatA